MVTFARTVSALKWLFLLVALAPSSAWAAVANAPTAAIVDVRMDKPPARSLAKRGRLDIVADGSDEEVRLYVREQLEEALDDYTALQVVRSGTGLTALREGTEDADKDPRIIEGRQALEAARQAMARAQEAKAEKLLLQAEARFTEAAGNLSTHTELLDVYLLLGNVYLGLGRKAAASDVFARAARLDPRFIPDPAKYPPQTVRALRIKQAAMKRAGLGRLQILSEPPGQTFVDGRFLGTTPVTVRSLAPGSHTVSVRRPGFKTWTATVDVPTFKPVRVEASLDPRSHPQWSLGFEDDRSKAVDSFGAPITDYYKIAAESIGANMLVYAWVDGDNMKLRAWRPGRGMSPTVQGVTNEADEALYELMLVMEDKGFVPEGVSKSSPLGAPRIRPRKSRLRTTLMAGQAVAPASGNFPGGNAFDLLVQVPYAPTRNLEFFGEVGAHANYQTGMLLVDGAGVEVLPTGERFTGLYLGLPIGAGVGFRPLTTRQLSPYVQGQVFVEPGKINFYDPLPDDQVSSKLGFGVGVSASAGVDRILSETLALRAELRYAIRFPGTREAQVDIGLTPDNPDFTLPVKAAGTQHIGLSVGILFQARP